MSPAPTQQPSGSNRGLAARLWSGLMTRLRRRLVLCRVLVREPHPSPVDVEQEDGVTLRLASFDDLLEAAEDDALQLDAAFVEQALERGDICLAAYRGEDLVAFVWRSFTKAPHKDGLWARVDWPYWYTYKMYTRPDVRGRRLSGLLSLYGDQVCRDRGYRCGVGFIETHNYASMRANRRLGSRPVGFAGYVMAFGRAFPFRTPGVVPHTFRFYRPGG